MLVSILNVNVDIDVHIDIERGPKKFFPTPGGSCLRTYVWYHGVNAHGSGFSCESTNFQCGLEKFDLRCCERRYVEGWAGDGVWGTGCWVRLGARIFIAVK